MTPRPYQSQAIDELRQGIRTHPGQPGLLVAPTGSGKSEIFGWMARAAVGKGRRVGAVVNRRILVRDLCKRVERLGLDYGVIMGSSPRKAWCQVHIASFDTLWRREQLPKWDLVFVDEAHFSLADKYASVIARLQAQGCIIIGMTATPIRGVSEGLGAIYKWMVRCPDTPDLIDAGYLVPPRVFAPPAPDLKDVPMVAGEFNQKQLAVACNSTKITGDILKHWMANGRGRPTIGFGVDIKHCEDMSAAFVAAGVRAIAIDHTYKGDFDLVWRKLANYETEVVFNVGIAGYGWDCPPVSHMIEARPTMSLGLWLQHCGRVMRVFKGKADAIINDHAGNSHRHGLPSWPRDWSLDGDAVRRGEGEAALSVTTCKTPVLRCPCPGPHDESGTHLPCYATFKTGPERCPYCNLFLAKQARKVEVQEGELSEYSTPERKVTPEGMRKVFDNLLAKQRDNGYRETYAAAAFKGMFGHWPPKEWKRSRRVENLLNA